MSGEEVLFEAHVAGMHEEEESLVVAKQYAEESVLDETGFEFGEYSYEEYAAQRHQAQSTLEEYDASLPEIYTLAEKFIWRYPTTALSAGLVERDACRRLLQNLDQAVEDDMTRYEHAAAIDEVMEDTDFSGAIDVAAVRDSVFIRVSPVYNISMDE